MNPIELLARSPLLAQPPLAIAANVVSALAFVTIAIAIVIDFRAYYRQDRRVVGSDRSFVETGSMTAFFVAYYLVIRFQVGALAFGGVGRTATIVGGMALVVLGVAFNVAGRLVLKSAWANQIRIYEGQRLLTVGPFRVVRHPLYASLIWTFAGGSLIYANPLSLALTAVVFVPMMYVRAKKEDAALLAVFGDEYARYRERTGMFLPKI